jgi:ABC-type transport system substrate-binding protein
MLRIEFADQWNPKVPWHDQRVRLAVNYALDRQAIGEAACLSYRPPAGVIVPRLLEYVLPVEPLTYNLQKAQQLLAEAGYPTGFDAGELVPISPFHLEGLIVYSRGSDGEYTLQWWCPWDTLLGQVYHEKLGTPP